MSRTTEISRELRDDYAAVTVRKIKTRMGSRVDIYDASADEKVEFDPLAAESLSWQTFSDLQDILEIPIDSQPHIELESATVETGFVISNEYSDVVFRMIAFDGERVLHIAPVQKPFEIALSPRMLSQLAKQSEKLFTSFLKQAPHGPEDH